MKVEEIRSALEDVSRETLADALSIVLAESKTPSQAVAGVDAPELANFAQAVIYLKKNYNFSELDSFTTESDLVYVETGGRRILLTDRMNAPVDDNGSGASGSHVKKEIDKESQVSPNGGRFSNLEI